MSKPKDDRYYAGQLLAEIDHLLDFASRVDFSDPVHNLEAIYAMNFCIVQMREIISMLSEDFQRNRLGIRVGQFADFRNLLVHEYGKTDYGAYKDFINNDVRRMKVALENYLGIR